MIQTRKTRLIVCYTYMLCFLQLDQVIMFLVRDESLWLNIACELRQAFVIMMKGFPVKYCCKVHQVIVYWCQMLSWQDRAARFNMITTLNHTVTTLVLSLHPHISSNFPWFLCFHPFWCSFICKSMLVNAERLIYKFNHCSCKSNCWYIALTSMLRWTCSVLLSWFCAFILTPLQACHTFRMTCVKFVSFEI